MYPTFERSFCDGSITAARPVALATRRFWPSRGPHPAQTLGRRLLFKPAPRRNIRDPLGLRDVPDHAAAVAQLVAGGLVHHEIIERLALIGPLLGAVGIGD